MLEHRTNTNKSKVNKIISDKLPDPGGTRTRLVIADFGFRTDLCPPNIFLDTKSEQIAAAVTSRIGELADGINIVMNAYPSGERAPSQLSDLGREIQILTNAQWHGTSCYFIAHADSTYANYFQGCMNIAPHVDVRLLYLDPLVEGVPYTRTFRSLERGGLNRIARGQFDQRLTPNYMAEQVVEGLQRIIDCVASGALSKGDVVVLPAQLEIAKKVLPLHFECEIEAKINELTTEHSIIVVIPAGNKFLDVSLGSLPGILEDNWCPSHIIAPGTACGAIVVAEDRLKLMSTATSRRGYRWIDAFLDFFPDGLGSKADMSEHARTVADELSLSISDADRNPKTSASSTAVACLIATVQEARRRRTLPPLKPFEARAHLRQWRHYVDGYKHAPPDILGWLIGTQVFRIGKTLEDDDCEIRREHLQTYLTG